MSLSLPADPPRARTLTRVVPEVVASLGGRGEWFPPASGAVLFVVDGLGARNLAARRGAPKRQEKQYPNAAACA